MRDWFAQLKLLFNKHKIGELLSENYALLAILIGAILISLPIGPYQTPDTQFEFNATQGVLRWGYPYLEVKGNFVDQPPLGFYTAALFFLVFGATLENGVVLITLFSLACTVLLYKLGKEAYGSKSTGLFAAAFFALAPWELVLSRAFLIDTQCLFLSLVCLYFGILAIRKDSVKLAAVAGIFFATAFLTKFYAIFMLIPLLLLYAYHRPKNPKQILLQLGVFSLPVVFSSWYWYQIVMGKGLFYLAQHNDFKVLNSPEVVPSYSFITTFLVDYGLGAFFLAAVVFSLTIGLVFWKRFSKQSLVFDLICLATIVPILGIDMYLGVTLNLKVPYTSAIKYTYQSLPFFSLIAASLASKSASLFKLPAKKSDKLRRIILFAVGLIGLCLLAMPILDNMVIAQRLTNISHLVFRVQPDLDVGYSFGVLSPINQNSLLLTIQFLGFLIMISGLLWASRRFLLDL
jgi:4-amino-4-deoxy-L-arabinose transferase-like glycosyltransferase